MGASDDGVDMAFAFLRHSRCQWPRNVLRNVIVRSIFTTRDVDMTGARPSVLLNQRATLFCGMGPVLVAARSAMVRAT